jgi:hypothetical protein
MKLFCRHELRYLQRAKRNKWIDGYGGHYVRKNGTIKVPIENVSQNPLIRPTDRDVMTARWHHDTLGI